MWSLDYVQVPMEPTNESKEVRSQNNSPMKATPLHNHRLTKQINISIDSSSTLMKSGSESSLSEDGNNKKIESSCKEWRSEQQDEKETCSDEEQHAPPVPVRRRRSRIHGGFRKSEGVQV